MATQSMPKKTRLVRYQKLGPTASMIQEIDMACISRHSFTCKEHLNASLICPEQSVSPRPRSTATAAIRHQMLSNELFFTALEGK